MCWSGSFKSFRNYLPMKKCHLQNFVFFLIAGEPIFTKPLQKETVKDYDDVTLKVRCDGVPKPDVIWYRDGKEITNDDRHKVTTEVGGQVDSELEIKKFNSSDAGKVSLDLV